MIFKILLILIIINFILLYFIEKYKLTNFLKDKPDGVRKNHQKVASSIGGTIFFFNILIFFFINELFKYLYNDYVIFNSSELSIYFLIALSALFTLGIIDDAINLNYKIKFLSTIILILVFLLLDNSFIINKINFSFFSETIYLNKLSIPFTILCILLFLNAFNMFDGINLQAGLYSLSLIFFFIQNDLFKILNLLMLIPLIIFLTKNYNGKVFLGNNGSILIPFFFSLLFINNYNVNNIKYADEIVIYMLIPGLDMFRLFIYRIYNKQNPFKADNNHLHHLIMKNSNYKNALIIILFLVFLPILLELLDLENILKIFIMTMIYFVIYYYYKIIKNKP